MLKMNLFHMFLLSFVICLLRSQTAEAKPFLFLNYLGSSGGNQINAQRGIQIQTSNIDFNAQKMNIITQKIRLFTSLLQSCGSSGSIFGFKKQCTGNSGSTTTTTTTNKPTTEVDVIFTPEGNTITSTAVPIDNGIKPTNRPQNPVTTTPKPSTETSTDANVTYPNVESTTIATQTTGYAYQEPAIKTDYTNTITATYTSD